MAAQNRTDRVERVAAVGRQLARNLANARGAIAAVEGDMPPADFAVALIAAAAEQLAVGFDPVVDREQAIDDLTTVFRAQLDQAVTPRWPRPPMRAA